MIQKFVDRFMANKDVLVARFRESPPASYQDIVRRVIETISDPEEYYDPDIKRIHEIDDGDYQGTLVYVIGSKGYQPCEYWYVRVSYGSCSGCDTLEAIDAYSDDAPKDYMTLALHIVQGLRSMQPEIV